MSMGTFNRSNPTSMINNWVMALQGSGDPSLNRVVNDLVQLRRHLGTDSLDSRESRELVKRIVTTAQQSQSTVGPLHAACLRQIEDVMQQM